MLQFFKSEHCGGVNYSLYFFSGLTIRTVFFFFKVTICHRYSCRDAEGDFGFLSSVMLS